MREVYTYGHIEDGQLKVHRRTDFLKAIGLLTPGRVMVVVKKNYRQRSLPENAYYWGVVINEFCEGYFDMTGEKIQSDQAHEILKQECNSKEVTNEKTGQVIKVPQTTAKMTTIEFEEYLESCRAFIFEWFNRRVPLPNEQSELFL